MLNLCFALFLFGMLLSNSFMIYRRAVNEQQPITVQQLALMMALAIGSLIALHRGAYTVYGVSLDLF